MMRLTIDGNGKIIRSRVEKSSGDKVFELSVTRAVALAEQTIVPPPGRTVYEGAFVFKPQGVSQK
jgi:colicin import membrane protein